MRAVYCNSAVAIYSEFRLLRSQLLLYLRALRLPTRDW